jgi:hypothetical protein
MTQAWEDTNRRECPIYSIDIESDRPFGSSERKWATVVADALGPVEEQAAAEVAKAIRAGARTVTVRTWC